jgi:hypothetical protein
MNNLVRKFILNIEIRLLHVTKWNLHGNRITEQAMTYLKNNTKLNPDTEVHFTAGN